jgi:hypothetical protein
MPAMQLGTVHRIGSNRMIDDGLLERLRGGIVARAKRQECATDLSTVPRVRTQIAELGSSLFSTILELRRLCRTGLNPDQPFSRPRQLDEGAIRP